MQKHNYKKLQIWQNGIELTDLVYAFAATLPENEKYGLRSQMTRAAVSIPSNIAEGSARKTAAFKQFLRYALGSTFELETQLLICQRRKYGDTVQSESLQAAISREQNMIFNFLKSLPDE